ncbi:hypothetical protein HDU96_007965 [Phlyctochytrium bullatum]|nr:hypothetical protein HDU96_007965 [Phlyctochytrium bullatum]
MVISTTKSSAIGSDELKLLEESHECGLSSVTPSASSLRGRPGSRAASPQRRAASREKGSWRDGKKEKGAKVFQITRVALAFASVIVVLVLWLTLLGVRRGGRIEDREGNLKWKWSKNLEKQLPEWPPRGGEADEEVRVVIREMMRHAWNGYKSYAWGSDDLLPVSQGAFNWSGKEDTFLYTPVDALSTLLLMNLHDEFSEAKELILKTFDGHFGYGKEPPRDGMVDNFEINLFETTIRFLGGLMSAHELEVGGGGVREFAKRDARLLDLGKAWATKALMAFDKSPGGIPLNSFNIATKTVRGGWAGYETVILAEAGTLQLEFQYLSDVTGDLVFEEKAMKALDGILETPVKVQGLYPSMLNGKSKTFINDDITLGGLGDSFYEYLLKLWLATGDDKFRRKYDESATALVNHLIVTNGSYSYAPRAVVTSPTDVRRETTFEHLSCFAGGMFALGAASSRSPRYDALQFKHFSVGKGIADACWASYEATATGIGAEITRIGSFESVSPEYHLRPEVIEAQMYMWRLTKDPVYRERGWKMIQSLQRYCKSSSGGYHGLMNVNEPRPIDRQESFFLAETLKYLYLLFSEDTLMPLDEYVFNTEAHPLSVRGHGQRRKLPWGGDGIGTSSKQWIPSKECSIDSMKKGKE